MASNFSLRSFNFCNRKAVLSEDTFNFRSNPPSAAKISVKELERLGITTNGLPKQFPIKRKRASQVSSKWVASGTLSSMESATDPVETILEDEDTLVISETSEVEFNRMHYLLLVLHKSARSFSLAIETLELAGAGPPVSMAWRGVDVHAWHKNIAYQVAVHALLTSAIEVELFLSQNRSNNPSPVQKILSPITVILENHIESQLTATNPRLVQWFRIVELPRLSALFMPLLKKWSVEYAGSCVAGTITAITCYAALRKLGPVRLSCALFSNKMGDAFIELMSMAHDLVSVDKLHHLAIEAGFEEDFLSHFGTKVLPCNNVEDTEFWIDLVQRKLSVAIQRESVTKGRRIQSHMVQENNLATLGIFAYLGRESRQFLSRHNIKDLDEQINDFLSYLESGFVFIYPQFATLSQYQLLMEVIIDEVGWLDFYAAYNCQLFQERKRSKNHPIQAELEIILYAVFTVCYDVISGFAHYTDSTQQVLDANLLDFLLQSQGLLSACLEDYWSAYDPSYDKTSDLQKIGERSLHDSVPSILMKGVKNASFIRDARPRPDDLRKKEKHPQMSPETQATVSSGTQPGSSADFAKPKTTQLIGFKKAAMKLVAASVDVWMGTQLLFVDISDILRLMTKKLCGHKVTKRERRKMRRTMTDFLTLIPVTILMLLPVSAVGHAAMFAAIKKYMPFLIPSPYSDERLSIVKQLKRRKKMEVPRLNPEDAASRSKVV